GALAARHQSSVELLAPAMLQRLAAPDRSTRRRAVETLGVLALNHPERTRGGLELFQSLLGDGDMAVRRVAADALALLVRRQAEQLANLLPGLLAALGDPDRGVRSQLLAVVASLAPATPEVINALAQALRPDLAAPGPQISLLALEQVGQVAAGRPEVLSLLVRDLLALARGNDPDLAEAAAKLLGQALSADPSLAPQVLGALLEPLGAAEASARAAGAQLFATVALHLPRIAPELPQVLFAVAQDPDPQVQAAGLEALGAVAQRQQPPAPRALEVLSAALATPGAQGKAAEVLAQVAASHRELREAVRAQLEPLLSHSDPEVQAQAAVALARLAESASAAGPPAQVLRALAQAPSPAQRASAAARLGQVAARWPDLASSVLPVVLALLNDSDRTVQLQALEALRALAASSLRVASTIAAQLIPLAARSDALAISAQETLLDIVGQQGAELALPPLPLAPPRSTAQLAAASRQAWVLLDMLADAQDASRRAAALEGLATLAALFPEERAPVETALQRWANARAPHLRLAAERGSAALANTGQPAARYSAAERKAFAITGAFEGGGFSALVGNFDGQGLSFGFLQWNFGQGTLQPLLRQMYLVDPAHFGEVFGAGTDQVLAALASREAGLAFAGAMNDERKRVAEPWASRFRALGRIPAFQQVQMEAAQRYLERAKSLAIEFGLESERGLALMFDIAVQNGSIRPETKEEIWRQANARANELGRPLGELELMEIIANARADAANPQFAEDVRTRKLTIVRGQGRVHGLTFDLARQYDLGDTPWEQRDLLTGRYR
ncbi:MAG: hypothetical protein HY335_04480, partial [Deinococcus sp.]|nr:hypothetical protein [Deinococcus sp.]